MKKHEDTDTSRIHITDVNQIPLERDPDMAYDFRRSDPSRNVDVYACWLGDDTYVMVRIFHIDNGFVSEVHVTPYSSDGLTRVDVIPFTAKDVGGAIAGARFLAIDMINKVNTEYDTEQ
jgi:hypothetical protein